MGHNSQNDAILLLTVSLGKSRENEPNPLSVDEWSRLAAGLRERGLQPHDLLKGDLGTLLVDWSDRTITLSRLEGLLKRSGALALRMAKWEGAGLRAITRADVDYPALLKGRMKAKSPPVLFTSGDISLINAGGLAVVGSRNASEEDCQFTVDVCAHASSQGIVVISGGARGVDQSAMLGALDSEGTAVGVLSNSLLAESSSSKYRRHIMSGQLALVSPFNPEAAFNVGNAMRRNAYIYCLSDAALVIDSDLNKGGTWNGAVENVNARWVPLWVKKSDRPNCGNSELVRRGGQWLPDGMPDFRDMLGLETTSIHSQGETASGQQVEEHEYRSLTPDILDFYSLFLEHLDRLTKTKPLNEIEISEAVGIRKAQVRDWLARGMQEQRIEKVKKPTGYRLWNGKSMFEPR